jgi:protein-tyrosine phosphatase
MASHPIICFNRFHTVIDIHSHILAEVDDGPKSWEVSREMCRVAAEDGIEYIVATPHANDRYFYDREYLEKAVDHLRAVVGGKPEIGLGCDFHMSYDNIQDALKNPSRYTIDQTSYLLVELSNFSVPPQISDSLRQLRDIGLVPVLTHPERNPILQKSPARVLEWADMGVIVQVTASAFTGDWGESSKRTAQWLLQRDSVHIIASDCHDLKRRVPGLSAARQAATNIAGEDVAKALVDDNPRAIVHNQPLPFFPKPVMKRS